MPSPLSRGTVVRCRSCPRSCIPGISNDDSSLVLACRLSYKRDLCGIVPRVLQHNNGMTFPDKDTCRRLFKPSWHGFIVLDCGTMYRGHYRHPSIGCSRDGNRTALCPNTSSYPTLVHGELLRRSNRAKAIVGKRNNVTHVTARAS